LTATPPRTMFYQRTTIVFQARKVESGWLPGCTIICRLLGQMTKHTIQADTAEETEQEADDKAFELARPWIAENDNQMTSFPWRDPLDDDSKTMWRQ
jgi:hypothetical protein